VKAGAYFEQRPHAPVYFRVTVGWLRNPRKNFEQSTLAGAIAPDYPDNFAPLNLKTDIV
jgi:hypothetical protein